MIRDFSVLKQIKEYKPKIDAAKEKLAKYRERLNMICELAKKEYWVDMSDILQLPIELGETVYHGTSMLGTFVYNLGKNLFEEDGPGPPTNKALRDRWLVMDKERDSRYKKVMGTRKERLQSVKNVIMKQVNNARNELCKLQSKVAGLMKSLYDTSCMRLNEIKSSQINQRTPYNDPFFNQPLTGKHSSSYFANIGMCFAKFQDENYCKKNRFIWAPNPLYNEISKQMFGEPPGFCFKSRYAYVDNSPGITGGNFKKLDGLTPSIANAVSAMSPEKTLSISLGYSVPGFRMQPCDKIATAKFTTIRDLAEYIEDDLTVDNPVRLTRQHIDAIVREVLRLSKNPTQRNGLVKIKEKPYHLMEPSEIKDMIENLKKIIKVNPDNSTFNKSMINSNKDIFTVKKKSAMATQMYIFHNIKAYMVTWISEPPEKPITKPMRLVFCDEYAGGVCRLSNGLQFKNPYIQDTWAPFITIKIGNFRMSNLKPDKPVDGEPENFSQMTKKYTEKDRLYHSSIILLVLVCILYIISIR